MPCETGRAGCGFEMDSRERTEEIVANLIQSHQKAFPATPMVLNLVLSEYRAAQQAIQEGCWVRRDSYHHWFQADQAQYGLMKRPDAAMIFETVMPGISMEDNEDPAFFYAAIWKCLIECAIMGRPMEL